MLAATTLENAGMDTTDWLIAARMSTDAAAARPQDTQLIVAEDKEIMYDITFELPDAGHILHNDETAGVMTRHSIYPPRLQVLWKNAAIPHDLAGV